MWQEPVSSRILRSILLLLLSIGSAISFNATCLFDRLFQVVFCRGRRLTYKLESTGPVEEKDDCDDGDVRTVTVVMGQLSALADMVSVNSRCFISHHSLDMKFVSCDDG